MLSRWLVLFIVCIGTFGYNYCYDNPVALQNQLHSIYDIGEVKYALLYSIYAFPNAILPFFSGILTDIFGVNSMVLVFFLFILCGHALFTIGCMVSHHNFMIMIIGRLLLGIGSESYSLAITPLLYAYFKHKELAFAFGLTLSFARIGSSTNDYLTYYIYTITDSIVSAVSIGVWILLLCFILLLCLCIYRAYFEKQMMHSVQSESLHVSLSSEVIEIADRNRNTSDSFKSIIDNDGFQLKDIKEFDACYWLLTFNCGLCYGCVYPFMNIGSDFLQHTFDLSNDNANMLLMLPYIIGSVGTMCIGYLSDRIGQRGHMMLIASVLFVISHAVFILCILNQHNDIVYVVFALSSLGIAFSMFGAVIWPSFAFVVNERCLGTAYGFPTSFYNGVDTAFYIVVGLLTDGHYVNDHKIRDKYLNVEYFLFGVSLFSIGSVSLLLYMDHKSGNRLNTPSIK